MLQYDEISYSDKILPNILCILIFSIIFGIAYIKLKYPFWNIQPVFHTYDFWRYIYQTPFIIQRTTKPITTKFCDFAQIQTLDYIDLNLSQKLAWIDLLQSHYIPGDRMFLAWTPEYLDVLFSGHSNMCFVSFFKEKEYKLLNNGNPDKIPDISLVPISIVYNKAPIGCISSRPYTMYITSYNINTKHSAYFFDFMCVHREYVSKNYYRNLIQTHEYNQRIGQKIKDRDIAPTLVSVFKREGDLCQGVVPLITYITYIFKLPKMRIPGLPVNITITRIFKENTHEIKEFIENIHTVREFGVIAVPSISVIISQISSQKLFVFVLKHKTETLGYYFFKDTMTHFEMDGETECKMLQIFASYCNTDNILWFYRGFLHSLYEIMRLRKPPQLQYEMLVWENISHNTVLFQRWIRYAPIWIQNPTSYYLYNMVCPKTFKGENGLFL